MPASDPYHARPRLTDAALRVLVVEDQRSARVALRSLLADFGYACAVATNGNQALEEHLTKPFDLILSDWSMPNGDGMELCRGVRAADGAGRYTYFILMTAHADKEHLVGGLRGGADDFIAKPIDVDELEARLVAAERVVRLHKKLAARNRSLRRDSQRFFRAAHLDPLTQVANRRQLGEDLPRLVQPDKHRGPACIAIADVDHFKLYNDTFGHLAGDDVLRQVADSIRRSLRQSDSVYRYGGEEFLALLTDQSLSEARVAMERVRHGVESLSIKNPKAASGLITVSIGLAAFDAADGADPTAWLARADAALYRAKRLGRNRCEQAP